jgi:hypothetical protein
VLNVQMAIQNDTTQSPPIATGGSVTAGDYALTTVTYYNAAQSGTHIGAPLTELLSITAGNGLYTIQGDTPLGPYTATDTAIGTSMTIHTTCGVATDRIASYTFANSTLTLFIVGASGTVGYQYTPSLF